MHPERDQQHDMNDLLQDSEALLRAVIENLPGGAAFVVDPDLRYRFAEGEALAAAGFTPEDLVGRTIFEVLPPELAARYEVQYCRALAGEPFEVEHESHDRFYISRGKPLRSASGEVYAVLVVSYDITERKRAEADRQQAETATAADLEDMQRLRDLSAQLVTEDDIQTLYQEIVAIAIALTRADAGTVQILDEATQDFLLLAAQGFEQEMTDRFYRVEAGSSTSCEMALETGDRAFIDFDELDEDPNGDLRLHLEAGFLTAQSTPLISRSGKTIGMVSTHWRSHHRPTERELRFLDLLARQAADLIEQRQAQITLRESEARLQSIANLVPDLLWDSEPGGSTNWYNQRWMEYTGQTFDEAIGWGWIDVIHPDDREGSARRYREAVEQGVQLQQEHRIRRYDGAYRWFVVKASPLKDESGRVIKMYGAATDIHDQRIALEALRESEERFRTLANTAPALIWFNDAQGENLFINQHFQDFTGKSAEQIRGEGWHELVHPDDAENYIADYLVAVREQRPWHNRNRIRRHDGVWRWHDNYARPLFDAEGIYLGHVGVTIDNTDAIEAENALRESEERQAFLLQLSDAIKPLTDPVEIMATVSETVGRYYKVGRCGYAEVPPPYDHLVVARDWTNGIMQSLQGSLPLVVFGDEIIRQYRTGQTIVVEDAFEDARNEGKVEGLEAAGDICSSISVQLIKEGHWVAYFYVQDTVRRSWTQNEVNLMEDIAERTWAALERARAEDALGKSEAKYRTLFASIDEGFALAEVIYDSAGQPVDILYLESNPAASRLTGVPDFTQRRISEVMPGFESSWVELYDRVARTGVSERTEQYAAPLDRWYDFYVFPIEAASGKHHQVAVIFQDISDRKRRERQQEFLLKFSDYLRTLADEKTIEETSLQMLAEFLGLDRAYIPILYKLKDLAVIRAEYRKDGLTSILGEVPMSDFPEGIRQIEEQTLVVNDIATDPTLSDLDKASLAALNLQALVAANVRKGERNVIWSLVASTATPRPWTKDEVELIETVAERTWAAVERAKAETALRESELQRVREQSAREEERQRAESLAELDRAKTLFFTNISHEFRTPLTLSLAPLRDALKSVDEWESGRVDEQETTDNSFTPLPIHPSTLKHNLQLVHRNNLRLLKLVNTLLDFSRIEAGRMEAVYEPTDLATYTAELASVFRSALERAGLQLIVDCSPLPEPVFVDREMWEKIVLNLLSNAFKFTFEGEIRVSLHSTDRNQVILQIQDTGTGIATEHLPHLFERFYQVRGTQARTHEGSGIGLALVHELVRLHGGTIEVSSTVGEGTCFTIALPFGTDHLPSDRLHFEGDRYPVRTLASTAMGATAYVEEAERWLPTQNNQEQTIENTEEQTTQTADSSFPSLTSARVLVVDDNADMREYLTRILSEHVQVEAVADGITALAAAQERVPDLILSDVMMPGLDGFKLLEALRADSRTREIPIILLSARAGEEAIVEGLGAGADDYLIKPFSAQELISRVTAHLQMAQLRGEALQQERIINRQKDEFISVVSHELNTPLVSILGWTRMLRSSPPNPVMLSKALDTIERNATLQGKLVQDLLDLSRISAGKLRINPQPIELKPVIETAIATVTQTAAEKGIDLIWQEDVTEPVVVMGDSDRLSQVLINLLTNAIKFTPESGSVTLELFVMNNNSSADASYAEIRVTDTGIGIAADFLPHVFDRFSQAQDANAAKGLGLGLAIARHIIERHNGTIFAESTGEGQGATFTIQIPLAPLK